MIRIATDGGTSCNIPSKGYGEGYGSYQIDDEPIVRVNHARPMSNNAAEIWTMVSALEALRDRPLAFGADLEFVSDSKIALKWVTAKSDPPKKGSEEFIGAVLSLRWYLQYFGEVKTRWVPREEMVELFGH